VLLVSSNEWDVTGAASSGLRTAWLGRGRDPSWVLGVEPDLVVDSLADLAPYSDRSRPARPRDSA
jgi:FMN phosphatase YigB (HAD superfamily)